jgi:Acyltransferase
MQQITRAQAPLSFLPPNFQLWVLKLVVWLLPSWLKHQLKISQINVSEIDRLVSVYKQSQMGTSRLILAFRHSSRDDIFCLAYLLTKLLPLGARQHQILLKDPVFAHFLTDSTMERLLQVRNAKDKASGQADATPTPTIQVREGGIRPWVGNLANWIYLRLGGISIHRSQRDRLGLKTAKELLINGSMPLAIAPEGGMNGHSELVSPLEFRAAKMGFWGMADLVKVGRTEDVLILPIGIQYYYVGQPWVALEKLLNEMELDCGLKVDRQDSLVAIAQGKNCADGEIDGQPMRKLLYDRFYKLSQYILYQMENFYAQFYHYEIPERPHLDRAISRTTIAQRLKTILNFALKVSEDYFNLESSGTTIDRCGRIDRAGLNWIYREELKNSAQISPIGRKLADRIATEADLRMWHIHIVAGLATLTSTYLKDKPSIERFAETALLLWDLMARIQGKNPLQRPIIGDRRVEMTIGNSISIGDYWNRYTSSERESQQVIIDVTEQLQAELERMVEV